MRGFLMQYQRIKDLREDKDLSQAQIAKSLNISQRTYSYYEKGEHQIPLNVLCNLAEFHRVSIDYLLNRTDIQKPYPPSKHKKEE